MVYGLLRRFTPRNDEGDKRQHPTLSLRGFKKAAAILGWDTGTVKQNSSLRELLLQFVAISVLGTIVYSWNSFFSVFVFIISGFGLLRRFTPRNDDRN